MILSYKFKNFMSFQDDVEFSMMAPKTKVKSRFPDNYTSVGNGLDLLKTAVIVGENAGGKSNFVRSLQYLRSFFTENESVRSYRSRINTNNLTNLCPQNSCTKQMFELEIYVSLTGTYLYHLEVDFAGIVTELLYFKINHKNKYKLILEVSRADVIVKCDKDNCEEGKSCQLEEISAKYVVNLSDADSAMADSLKAAAQKQKHIGLMVTKLAILGNEHAMNFTEWVINRLCPETNFINYDIYKSMKNEGDDLRILTDKKYLDIFRMIDYSIEGFTVDEEKPFTKTLVIRRKNDGSTFSRELGRDSSGVREFFAWAVQIYKVVYEDKVVFADEMDRVLNPVLSDRVIAFISGKKHAGQFVFTTHNVLHLDLINYMKEQIYFITKDSESLESELYSLADFPEIRYETTKIYEFYMKGILGGTAVE